MPRLYDTLRPLLALCLFSVRLEAASDEHHKYCIVGGGPAGVQIGHYLLEAGRDFVILERNPRAASWFAKFPNSRVLNSINRRFSRRDPVQSPEFNLRQDWNSLLGSEKTVGLFGSWSHEYLPSADSMVEYVNAFAQAQVDAGHLLFNQNVQKIAKCKPTGSDDVSRLPPSDRPKCAPTGRYVLTVETTSVDPTVEAEGKCEVHPGGGKAGEGMNKTGSCGGRGKPEGVMGMGGMTMLAKKVADLESTVRDAALHGSFDLDAMKELVSSKEALRHATVSSSGFGLGASADNAPKEEPKTVVNSRTISCSVLVMANGMHKPRRTSDAWVPGLGKVSTDYSDLSNVPRSDFENRSVLILGYGNAALETADHLRSVARDIVILRRSEDTKYMSATRYAGDLRMRHLTAEEALTVKSYEGSFQLKRNNIIAQCGPDESNLGFQGKPCGCLFASEKHESEKELVTLLLPVDDRHTELIKKAQDIFGSDVFIRNSPKYLKDAFKVSKILNLKMKVNVSSVLYIHTKTLIDKNLSLEQRQLLIQLADHGSEVKRLGSEFRKPYDVVITALGWQYDHGPFDFELAMVRKEGAGLVTKGEEAYPSLNGEFESTNNPHLFMAGAAAHGIDRWRYRSSGGFIHGFRFNCRSLYRLLEERYEAEKHPSNRPIALSLGDNGWLAFPWNFLTLKSVDDIPDDSKLVTGIRAPMTSVWGKLQNRVNDAAGPYEMVGGSLVDAIIFDCNQSTAFYLEDLPEDMVHKRYSSHPRLTFSFHHGHSSVEQYRTKCRHSSGGVFTTMIHPVLQYFPAGLQGPRGKTFSQAHQQKYQDHIVKKTEDIADEHPSAYWTEIKGVSRMHIGATWIYQEWGDIETIRQIEIFTAHVEHSAAQFCKKEGPGTMERKFDEALDTALDDIKKVQKIMKAIEKECDH